MRLLRVPFVVLMVCALLPRMAWSAAAVKVVVGQKMLRGYELYNNIVSAKSSGLDVAKDLKLYLSPEDIKTICSYVDKKASYINGVFKNPRRKFKIDDKSDVCKRLQMGFIPKAIWHLKQKPPEKPAPDIAYDPVNKKEKDEAYAFLEKLLTMQWEYSVLIKDDQLKILEEIITKLDEFYPIQMHVPLVYSLVPDGDAVLKFAMKALLLNENLLTQKLINLQQQIDDKYKELAPALKVMDKEIDKKEALKRLADEKGKILVNPELRKLQNQYNMAFLQLNFSKAFLAGGADAMKKLPFIQKLIKFFILLGDSRCPTGDRRMGPDKDSLNGLRAQLPHAKYYFDEKKKGYNPDKVNVDWVYKILAKIRQHVEDLYALIEPNVAYPFQIVPLAAVGAYHPAVQFPNVFEARLRQDQNIRDAIIRYHLIDGKDAGEIALLLLEKFYTTYTRRGIVYNWKAIQEDMGDFFTEEEIDLPIKKKKADGKETTEVVKAKHYATRYNGSYVLFEGWGRLSMDAAGNLIQDFSLREVGITEAIQRLLIEMGIYEWPAQNTVRPSAVVVSQDEKLFSLIKDSERKKWGNWWRNLLRSKNLWNDVKDAAYESYSKR